MLEESIRNHEKVHPAEIALSMLSFLQSELPAGGTAAETRFFNIFVPLCECIFGPVVISTSDHRYRHKESGWLSSPKPWTRALSSNLPVDITGPPSPLSMKSPRNPLGNAVASPLHLSTPNVTMTSPSLDSDPVVKLLGTAGKSSNTREPLPMTLVEAISNVSNNRPSVTFPLPLRSLPQPLQDAWLALIKQSMRTMSTMGINRNVSVSSSTSPTEDRLSVPLSPNDVRLLDQLLRKRPMEQIPLQTYVSSRSQSRHSQHAHVEYRNERVNPPSPLWSQRTGSSISNSTNNNMSSSPSTFTPYAFMSGINSPVTVGKEGINESNVELSPDVLLSMLEYYLFLFLRFPLAAPERSGSSSGVSGTGMSSIPGINVHTIPSSLTTATSSDGSYNNSRMILRETFGETLYYQIFRRYIRHFLPYETEDNGRSIALYTNKEYYESELFLRLVVAMWLEGHSRLLPTKHILQSMEERRRHRTGWTDTNDTSTIMMLDLDASYDLTQTMGKYEPLPNQIHKCLRTLIIHVILDPAVHPRNQSFDSTTRNSYIRHNHHEWLSPCMTILQQPVYNYIRSTFRFAPIHSSSESSFYGALNIWLIWLEPWNVSQSRTVSFSAKTATQHIIGSTTGSNDHMMAQRTLTIPRMNQPSKYVEAEWESYIAANVYMYAVPLAIFLRRARELDFSPKKYERSMEIVQRVFRVFTPAVVDAISRHLDALQYMQEDLSSKVKFHRDNLGSFAPPLNQMSLNSLKADMQGLLEEVIMHHVKKVRELDNFDWLMGKIEGWFGAGVVSGEEKTLDALMERANIITRLPCDFATLLHKGRFQSKQIIDESSTAISAHTRTKDGSLTTMGREQLLAGHIKLNPDEVQLCGNPMRVKVKSYEIPFLVDLSLCASDWLNELLGFTNGKGQFQINLRFFADYRNLIFVAMTLYITLRLLQFKV